MNSRMKDRKAVRKANKRSAVDQEKSKRTFRAVAAVICALLFVVIETYVLSFAKIRYDHNKSIDIAEEMSVQLSLLSSALQTGNKALYDEALSSYREQLNLFEKNSYVRYYATDLRQELGEYITTLDSDVAIVSQIIEIHVAINRINTAATDAIDSEVDAVNVYAIGDDYNALREGLENITAPELDEIKTKLIALSDEMVKYTENAAVCIGICADDTLQAKQADIKNIIERHQASITKLAEQKSASYDPAALIQALAEYCKL